LNAYQTEKEGLSNQKDYELQYGKYADLSQPSLKQIDINVDIFPKTRDIECKCVYILENRSPDTIQKIMLSFSGLLMDATSQDSGSWGNYTIHTLTFNRDFIEESRDLERGVIIIVLVDALLPGSEIELEFEISVITEGFPNGVSTTRIVENGTFVDSMMLLPGIGYQSFLEITNDRQRNRLGLDPKPDTPAIDDVKALNKIYFCSESSRLDLKTTISTSEDQIALAPGTLVNQWEENNRNYFRYETRYPIWNFFAFLSGEYQVIREKWEEVDIEIYYHPGHEYNLGTMLQASRESLEYFSTNYGPYLNDHLRIVEFPRYNGFAQSFYGLIPFSESIGFIADVDPDDENDVDYPYYITAHEIAHQWWGHQVCPAGVQGACVGTETLARFSADILMKKRLKPKTMNRYMRLRLDEYLRGRSEESEEEVPVYLASDRQLYLYYSKGELVMYALADYIGEDAVNRALSGFLNEFKFKKPPFPTSLDLLRYLKAQTPEHLHYLIEDSFQKIVIYDLRCISADAVACSGGYDILLELECFKYNADGLGNETEEFFQETMDIGLLDSNRNIVHRSNYEITNGKTLITLHTDQLPAYAGIDPSVKRIDRNPADNVVTVTQRL